MANLNLAQVEYLSQQLTHQLNDVKHLTSKAWIELGVARDTLRSLLIAYDKWEKERGLNQDEQK